MSLPWTVEAKPHCGESASWKMSRYAVQDREQLLVSFVEPAGLYQQLERASKYGFLFIGLTFAAFLLLELLRRLAIHPIQYALVGLALAMFFLLLTALSEHIDFTLAYGAATLAYFALDPVHRRFHHDQLTFAMMYEHSERFIMPLSHDEVVHLKGSLLEKMPGDLWQKFANLRLLYTYQYTRPGKALLFMGSEIAPYREWNHEQSLDWHLASDPVRAAQGVAPQCIRRSPRLGPSLALHR